MGMTGGTFGEYFKSLRLKLGVTLRDFCQQNGFDPGNISKLERGIFPPPQSDEKLHAYAQALRLRKGRSEWIEFFDRAAAESGRLPKDIQGDPAVIRRLPAFFRTLRDKKLSGNILDKLIEKLRNS